MTIRSLHWPAADALDALYQHRLLTTALLAEMVMRAGRSRCSPR